MTEIRNLRFLVVEDHDFQRWHCCNVLRELGATLVYPARNGREAQELLSNPHTRIDVLVTDLDMPEIDGMALIREVAERSRDTSLVIVTGMERSLTATVEAMAHAYGIRLLGAIHKPVTANKLQALLAKFETPAAATPAEPAVFTTEEMAEGFRGGHFEVFVQPKVELASRAVSGAEALVRWRHPRLGLLFPVTFLPALEAAGLGDELTWLVAKVAAENCHAWRGMGLDIGVSVNLSVPSLQDTSLADRLIAIAAAAGLHPRYMTLEITESAAAQDLGRTLESLSRLRMRGFGLSIDDFGTGYSSMTRLVRVPFTELKIDQTFVRGATTDASCRAAVESSLQVASRLGISAVAEGVETSRDLELLRALGCPLVQGYYIARPMPCDEFMDWLGERGRASA